MQLSDFDFDLPEALIALRPVSPRRAARMLVASGAASLQDRHFGDLPGLLRPGDLLVFNDTKVIPARLRGTRARDSNHGSGVAQIEVTLTRRAEDHWRALARPAKRLAPGDVITFASDLSARVLAREGGEVQLAFTLPDAELMPALDRLGEMPLPPYIASKRAADDQDRADYQTHQAKVPGAVAAPTASLHFDGPLMAALAAAGIDTATLTLHVGAGTFLPVTDETVRGHTLHAEWGELDDATVAKVNAAKARGARVIPVGTTALRLLESAAASGTLHPWSGDTDIF
ncbi:MAG: S-adenosylmethionine:tRNA ribosyltransferase-isomerase, partial [Pseudomonadota bacterium]